MRLEKKYKITIIDIYSLLRHEISVAFCSNVRIQIFLEPQHTPFIFISIEKPMNVLPVKFRHQNRKINGGGKCDTMLSWHSLKLLRIA